MFGLDHKEVCDLVTGAGNTMHMVIERSEGHGSQNILSILLSKLATAVYFLTDDMILCTICHFVIFV